MKAWDNFVAVQETELGTQVVNRWLRTMRVLRFDACNLYLEARDAFHQLWFEEHLRQKVEAHLRNNNGRLIKVHVQVDGQEAADSRKTRTQEHVTPDSGPFQLTFDGLDEFNQLGNWITEPTNELAFKLAQEVIATDGNCGFNPVFLWGPPGSGKTHLLQAVAATLRKQGIPAVYARAETFIQHVINAIRAGQMGTFRESYRDCQVLLLDDVQEFSRKGTTQEELHHTFNALHTAGRQVVLSANQPPGELQEIEARLISRFEWGIVTPMAPLSPDRRGDLVNARAQALGLQISEKATEYLLETFARSVTSLMRAVEALALRGHMGQGSRPLADGVVTLAAAKVMLRDLAEAEDRAAITPERIITAVAVHHGITTEDILGSSKSRECVQPRQQAMYLCRDMLNLPYTQLGRLFGRDHSTVMSATKQIAKRVEEHETELEAVLTTIKKTIHSDVQKRQDKE